VTLAREGEAVEDFIARADDAMYRAKGVGRNAVTAVE
jgi:PleD family two-component response regulator